MNINILKNILLLCLIIFLFLIISNDEKYNTFLNKNKFNYLILLLLIYFIYIEIPLSIVIVFLLVILILNKQFYNKYLRNNKYLKEYLPDIESFDNKDKINENTNEKDIENFNFSPYNNEVSEEENKAYDKNNKLNEELFINNIKNKDELKEPFKDKVKELKKHLNNAINNNN